MTFNKSVSIRPVLALRSSLQSVTIWSLPVVLSLAALSLSVSTTATTLPYKSFDDLMKEADGVVTGRIVAVESQYNQNKEIYTFVTLDQIEILSGSYQGSTLTLRLKGGQVENDISRVIGSPQFQVNDQVLLFVHGNGRYMVPFVGWTQGVFRVVQDPRSGQQVIHDLEGNRVVGVQKGQILRDQVIQPEASIVGQQQGLGTASNQSQADAGSPDSQQPTSASRTAAQANALRSMPTMTSRAFFDMVRGAASQKVSKNLLNSVNLMDFSVASGNADASVGPKVNASETIQHQGAPVQPKRKQAPSVKDQY